jgi:antitoxin PrlF
MSLAHSRLTAQGQISVPAQVRRKLGLGPGSVLEWDVVGEQVIVRRVGRNSSADIHASIFARPPRARSLREMKEGVQRLMKKRHAGR